MGIQIGYIKLLIQTVEREPKTSKMEILSSIEEGNFSQNNLNESIAMT